MATAFHLCAPTASITTNSTNQLAILQRQCIRWHWHKPNTHTAKRGGTICRQTKEQALSEELALSAALQDNASRTSIQICKCTCATCSQLSSAVLRVPPSVLEDIQALDASTCTRPDPLLQLTSITVNSWLTRTARPAAGNTSTSARNESFSESYVVRNFQKMSASVA